MKRVGFLLLTIVLLAPIVSAQVLRGCLKEVKDAPAIRGLKLGMTEKEVENLLTPNSATRNEILGNKREPLFKEQLLIAGREASFDAKQLPGFDGIDLISLRSYDGKVYDISVSYAEGPQWKNVGEFVDHFSPLLGIDRRVWEIENDYGATADCRDFVVRLRAEFTSSSLVLTDPAMLRRIIVDQAVTNEQKKKAIKP